MCFRPRLCCGLIGSCPMPSSPRFRCLASGAFWERNSALSPSHCCPALLGGEPLSRSFQRTLRVWWEFIWRNVVYSVILRIAGSIALSMTIGILAALGGPMRAIVPFVSQVLIDGAVGLFVIYSGILDEEFGDFRVTLVPSAVALSAAPAVEPAPNSLT